MIRKPKSVYESISASDVVYLLSSTNPACSKQILDRRNKSSYLHTNLPEQFASAVKAASGQIAARVKLVKSDGGGENALFDGRCHPPGEDEGSVPLLGRA